MFEKITRRQFIKEITLTTNIVAVSTSILQHVKGEVHEHDKIPKRVLGKTGLEVSILSLGMGPIGINDKISQSEAEKLIDLCIDLGINYIDVAPNYGNGEEKLGNVMKRRRDEVFLATKVEEQSKNGALKQVCESLKKLQTDHLDVVHLHNIGGFNLDEVLGKDGALSGLLEAKEKGLIRFIGISGHERPKSFLRPLQTEQIDVIMPVINFADKFTYNFESSVLPEAVKRKAGILAMKVLGGAVNMQYDKPMPALMPKEYYQLAIRYALSVNGISSAVIGLKNEDEILQAVSTVKQYKPISKEEMSYIDRIGKELSAQWGEHFGPIS